MASSSSRALLRRESSADASHAHHAAGLTSTASSVCEAHGQAHEQIEGALRPEPSKSAGASPAPSALNASPSAVAESLDVHAPPSLNYDFRRRMPSLARHLAIIALMNSIPPTLAYYVSTHLSDDSPAQTYTWITLCLGLTELLSFPHRIYLLCRRNYERSARPLAAPHKTFPQRVWAAFAHFDTFQWLLLFGILEGVVLLTVASSINGDQGDYNLMLLSLPIIFATIGGIFLLSMLLAYFHVSAPRWPLISSLQPGEALRPAIFFILEDLTAVDGGGGLPFRHAMARRYLASQPFRRLCMEETAVFSAWGLLFPLWIGILIASTSNRDVSYGASVGIALLWSALIALAAYGVLRRGIRREKEHFAHLKAQAANA